MAAQDVVIIGAGVAGLSTARALLGRGASVTVVDSATLGGVSSRAAAGVCVPSVRLLEDLTMFRFTQAARQALVEDLTALDANNLRRAQGVIRPAPDEKIRAAMEEKGAKAPGHLGRWATAEELFSLEPALKGGQLYGAFVNDDGFMLDVDRYLAAMLHDVGQRGGTVRLGEPVVEVREEADHVAIRTGTGNLRADRLIVCAGAWSGQIPGVERLPVRPQRGQLISVFHPTVRLTRILSGAAYIAPWKSGEIVVGATEEEAGFANHTTPAGMLFLTAYLAKLAPVLKEARFSSHWSGLRSTGPGGRLMLGPVPKMKRTFIGAANGGQGILTGALVGRVLTEWLLDGRSELGEPFDPARALDAPAAAR